MRSHEQVCFNIKEVVKPSEIKGPVTKIVSLRNTNHQSPGISLRRIISFSRLSLFHPIGKITNYEWQRRSNGQGRNDNGMLRPRICADANHHAREPKNEQRQQGTK